MGGGGPLDRWYGVALGALLLLATPEDGVQLAVGLLLVLVPVVGVVIVCCAERDQLRKADDHDPV